MKIAGLNQAEYILFGMKNCFLLLLCMLMGIGLLAQNNFSTDVLIITGKVKKEKTFSLDQIRANRTVLLGEVNISCSPKQKEDAKGVKAIMVKDLIDSVKFDYPSGKMLNQFYFKFEASDGYAVVFSFNEIYNTETGKQLYIVTGKDGIDIANMDNRILMLSNSDLKPGSRNLKGLKRIVVCQAE